MIEKDQLADLGRLVMKVISETAAFSNDLNVQEEQDTQIYKERPFLAKVPKP